MFIYFFGKKINDYIKMELINKFYLSSIIISIIIFYLLLSDTKRIMCGVYNEINDDVWIKLYAFIMIGVVHLIWAFSVIFLDYNDRGIIYGFPVILLLPYAIYLIGELVNGSASARDDETTLSIKINIIMNYLMSIYILCIIILVLMPNRIKIYIIEWIKMLIHRVFKLIVP